MKSLQQNIYNSITSHKDSIAFNFESTAYSYFQLAEQVAFMQSVLTGNTRRFKSIGIIANQDFDTYATILAALLSGITYIPIEPSHPDERNNQILKLSKVNTIFCSDESDLSKEFYQANKSKFIKPDKGGQGVHELKIVPTNNPAYILFTSGSTGVPKGVPISLQNIQACIDNVSEIGLGINEESRFLQVFELTFDLSVFSYLVPLLNGASVYTLPKTPFKQMAAIQLIEEQSITHVLTVPSFVSFLRPFFKKITLTTVKSWLFCGEALKTDLVSEWFKCIPDAGIYNVYGPTEATIFCTSYKCRQNAIKEYHGIVSIGKPFKDVVFNLFDGTNPVNEHDTNAELCISGAQNTAGYLNDPEKNKKAFFTFNGLTYYRSGDLCQVDEDGDYFFSGRNDTQVKINGYRVEISELEYHAGDFPGIVEAVVIVTSNDKNDQQFLNLVYAAETEINQDEIRAFLSKKIPTYMMPGNIYFVASIPYNLNGKIDKRALAEYILKIS